MKHVPTTTKHVATYDKACGNVRHGSIGSDINGSNVSNSSRGKHEAMYYKARGNVLQTTRQSTTTSGTVATSPTTTATTAAATVAAAMTTAFSNILHST